MRKIWFATTVLAGIACAVPASAQQRVWQGGQWTSPAGRGAAPAMSSGIGAPPRPANVGMPSRPGNVGVPPRPGHVANPPRPGGQIGTPPRPGWNGTPPRPGGHVGNPPRPGWNGNPPRPGGHVGNPPRPGWNGNPPRPGGHIGTPPRPGWNGTPPQMHHGRPPRWQMNNGRWIGGWQAPGGWNSYRRLNRGAYLPSYWRGNDFRINDYASFGLFAPPQGYFWMRYYDDAILADEGGRVWDSIDGIGWDVDGYAEYDGYADGSWSESYAGVGGGYAVPSVEPYYDAPPPPAYGAPYPGGYAPSAPVVQVVPGQGGAYYNGGYYGANGYAASSYATGGYAYGGGTTTVVITPAPITTTTVVEEVIEEEVTTYVRTAPKRVLRKAPVRRYKPKTCVCR